MSNPWGTSWGTTWSACWGMASSVIATLRGHELAALPRQLEIGMSNTNGEAFSSKTPSERVKLRFNFARLTASPTNPVYSITQLSGPTDAAASDMRSGSATVLSGARAEQLVVAGLDGADYLVSCTVDAGTEKFTLQGVLPVRAR